MMVVDRTLGTCIAKRSSSLRGADGLRDVGTIRPSTRTFHSPKADVEKALHGISSYPGGKLRYSKALPIQRATHWTTTNVATTNTRCK